MSGLDCLGCDEIGFDWMQLAKGGAAALQGVGDVMSDEKGGKGGKPAAPPPPPPKPSIGIGTILLGVGAATLGLGAVVAIARR